MSAFDPRQVAPPGADETVRKLRKAALDEITFIDLRVRELQRQRKYAKDLIHAHSRFMGRLSPLNRVPNEVLVEIFRHYLHSGHNQPAGPSLPSVLSTMCVEEAEPWVLAQVCSSWRHAARACSSLWSSFRVELDMCFANRVPSNMVEAGLFRLKEALALSRERKLTIDFVAGSSTPLQVASLISLKAHCRRWKDVSFELDASLLGHLHGTKSRVPSLTSLRVDVTGIRGAEVNKGRGPLLSVFKNAPNLKTAHILGGGIEIFRYVRIDRWPNLTTFKTDHPFWTPAIELW